MMFYLFFNNDRGVNIINKQVICMLFYVAYFFRCSMPLEDNDTLSYQRRLLASVSIDPSPAETPEPLASWEIPIGHPLYGSIKKPTRQQIALNVNWYERLNNSLLSAWKSATATEENADRIRKTVNDGVKRQLSIEREELAKNALRCELNLAAECGYFGAACRIAACALVHCLPHVVDVHLQPLENRFGLLSSFMPLSEAVLDCPGLQFIYEPRFDDDRVYIFDSIVLTLVRGSRAENISAETAKKIYGHDLINLQAVSTWCFRRRGKSVLSPAFVYIVDYLGQRVICEPRGPIDLSAEPAAVIGRYTVFEGPQSAQKRKREQVKYLETTCMLPKTARIIGSGRLGENHPQMKKLPNKTEISNCITRFLNYKIRCSRISSEKDEVVSDLKSLFTTNKNLQSDLLQIGRYFSLGQGIPLILDGSGMPDHWSSGMVFTNPADRSMHISHLIEMSPLDMPSEQLDPCLFKRLRHEILKYLPPVSPTTLSTVHSSLGCVLKDPPLTANLSPIEKLRVVAGLARNHAERALAGFEFACMDPWEMSSVLHTNGANVRWMWSVWGHSECGAVRDMAIIAIISRCCKRLLYKAINAELNVILQGQEGNFQFDELVAQRQAVELFNRVLGSSPRSNHFWKFSLIPTIVRRFAVDMSDLRSQEAFKRDSVYLPRLKISLESIIGVSFKTDVRHLDETFYSQSDPFHIDDLEEFHDPIAHSISSIDDSNSKKAISRSFMATQIELKSSQLTANFPHASSLRAALVQHQRRTDNNSNSKQLHSSAAGLESGKSPPRANVTEGAPPIGDRFVVSRKGVYAPCLRVRGFYPKLRFLGPSIGEAVVPKPVPNYMGDSEAVVPIPKCQPLHTLLDGSPLILRGGLASEKAGTVRFIQREAKKLVQRLENADLIDPYLVQMSEDSVQKKKRKTTFGLTNKSETQPLSFDPSNPHASPKHKQDQEADSDNDALDDNNDDEHPDSIMNHIDRAVCFIGGLIDPKDPPAFIARHVAARGLSLSASRALGMPPWIVAARLGDCAASRVSLGQFEEALAMALRARSMLPGVLKIASLVSARILLVAAHALLSMKLLRAAEEAVSECKAVVMRAVGPQAAHPMCAEASALMARVLYFSGPHATVRASLFANHAVWESRRAFGDTSLRTSTALMHESQINLLAGRRALIIERVTEAKLLLDIAEGRRGMSRIDPVKTGSLIGGIGHSDKYLKKAIDSAQSAVASCVARGDPERAMDCRVSLCQALFYIGRYKEAALQSGALYEHWDSLRGVGDAGGASALFLSARSLYEMSIRPLIEIPQVVKLDLLKQLCSGGGSVLRVIGQTASQCLGGDLSKDELLRLLWNKELSAARRKCSNQLVDLLDRLRATATGSVQLGADHPFRDQLSPWGANISRARTVVMYLLELSVSMLPVDLRSALTRQVECVLNAGGVGITHSRRIKALLGDDAGLGRPQDVTDGLGFDPVWSHPSNIPSSSLFGSKKMNSEYQHDSTKILGAPGGASLVSGGDFDDPYEEELVKKSGLLSLWGGAGDSEASEDGFSFVEASPWSISSDGWIVKGASSSVTGRDGSLELPSSKGSRLAVMTETLIPPNEVRDALRKICVERALMEYTVNGCLPHEWAWLSFEGLEAPSMRNGEGGHGGLAAALALARAFMPGWHIRAFE